MVRDEDGGRLISEVKGEVDLATESSLSICAASIDTTEHVDFCVSQEDLLVAFELK